MFGAAERAKDYIYPPQKEEGYVIQRVVGASGPHLCCG